MATGKILIIDDDPCILTTVRRILERRGHQVVVHDGGPNCTNTALRENPDLVLIDVNMPFLSGDNIVGLFSRQNQLRTAPLVLFSSNDETQLRQLARACGADGYISKSELGLAFTSRVESFLTNGSNRWANAEGAPITERATPREHTGHRRNPN